MPQSYIYGSPYLGAAAAATQNPAASAGLAMQIPAATQLSHAAALAAATNQFYEYQVSSWVFFSFFFHFNEKKTVFWVFLDFLLVFLIFIFSSRYFQRNNSMKLKKPSARWERALSIVILINFRKIFHVISECVSRNCFSIPGTIQWIWSLSLCCSRNRWDLPSNEPSFPNH